MCCDAELNVTRRLQAHSRDLSPGSRPSQDQGVSSSPSLQMQHCFLCVFCAQRKNGPFVFSPLVGKTGPALSQKSRWAIFCHPCIKNQLQVIATLTNLTSVEIFLVLFSAEWSGCEWRVNCSLGLLHRFYKQLLLFCKFALSSLSTSGDFCRMENHGQAFCKVWWRDCFSWQMQDHLNALKTNLIGW